jgi:hypothetical protein
MVIVLLILLFVILTAANKPAVNTTTQDTLPGGYSPELPTIQPEVKQHIEGDPVIASWQVPSQPIVPSIDDYNLWIGPSITDDDLIKGHLPYGGTAGNNVDQSIIDQHNALNS